MVNIEWKYPNHWVQRPQNCSEKVNSNPCDNMNMVSVVSLALQVFFATSGPRGALQSQKRSCCYVYVVIYGVFFISFPPVYSAKPDSKAKTLIISEIFFGREPLTPPPPQPPCSRPDRREGGGVRLGLGLISLYYLDCEFWETHVTISRS